MALRTGQIKTGAPCRSERLAKYNQVGLINDLPRLVVMNDCFQHGFTTRVRSASSLPTMSSDPPYRRRAWRQGRVRRSQVQEPVGLIILIAGIERFQKETNSFCALKIKIAAVEYSVLSRQLIVVDCSLVTVANPTGSLPVPFRTTENHSLLHIRSPLTVAVTTQRNAAAPALDDMPVVFSFCPIL